MPYAKMSGFLLMVLVFTTGCGLFQPELSIEAAVAQLIPNDPSVGIGRNADRLIGDQEILIAASFWVKEQSVPRTGGKRINDSTMKALMTAWASGTLILK